MWRRYRCIDIRRLCANLNSSFIAPYDMPDKIITNELRVATTARCSTHKGSIASMGDLLTTGVTSKGIIGCDHEIFITSTNGAIQHRGVHGYFTDRTDDLDDNYAELTEQENQKSFINQQLKYLNYGMSRSSNSMSLPLNYSCITKGIAGRNNMNYGGLLSIVSRCATLSGDRDEMDLKSRNSFLISELNTSESIRVVTAHIPEYDRPADDEVWEDDDYDEEEREEDAIY